MKFRTNYAWLRVQAFPRDTRVTGDKRSIKNRARGIGDKVEYNPFGRIGVGEGGGNPRTGVRLIIIVAVIAGILLHERNY